MVVCEGEAVLRITRTAIGRIAPPQQRFGVPSVDLGLYPKPFKAEPGNGWVGISMCVGDLWEYLGSPGWQFQRRPSSRKDPTGTYRLPKAEQRIIRASISPMESQPPSSPEDDACWTRTQLSRDRIVSSLYRRALLASRTRNNSKKCLLREEIRVPGPASCSILEVPYTTCLTHPYPEGSERSYVYALG